MALRFVTLGSTLEIIHALVRHTDGEDVPRKTGRRTLQLCPLIWYTRRLDRGARPARSGLTGEGEALAVNKRAGNKRAVNKRAVNKRAVNKRAVNKRAVNKRAVNKRAVNKR